MNERSLTLSIEEESVAGSGRAGREPGRDRRPLAEEALQRYLELQTGKSEKIRHALADAEADAGGLRPDQEMVERLRADIDSGSRSAE